jgi:cytochrome c-type biogenesis protein CcmH/NrfG
LARPRGGAILRRNAEEAAMRRRNRQGGWVGIIVLLLAVLIVAMLGKTLLQQMGLSGAPSKDRAVARPGNVDVDTATPAPMQALERARGLQQQVQQQARDNATAIDKAAQ